MEQAHSLWFQFFPDEFTSLAREPFKVLIILSTICLLVAICLWME